MKNFILLSLFLTLSLNSLAFAKESRVDSIIDEDSIDRLDEVSAIDLGFPGEFYKEDGVRLGNFGGFYGYLVPGNDYFA